MSANIITVTNQEGGAGKITTTVNLTASLASRNKRVLVIDLDPQGNATTGSGVDKASIGYGVYQVVLDEAEIKDAVIRSNSGHFDMLATNRALTGAEVELVQEIAHEVQSKNALKAVESDYDLILVSCPSSLALLALNGLVATNSVVMPVLCEYYMLEGISDLTTAVRKIRQTINPDLEVLGIVCAVYDACSHLVAEVSDQFQQHFGGLLFDTTIPHSIRLAEVPSHGMPVLVYNASVKGARTYLELVDELPRQLNRPA